MWTIKFSKTLYEKMIDQLFRKAPDEDGCFLIGNLVRSKSNNQIIVIEMISADEDSWEYQNEDSLGPSSSFINKAVVQADSNDACLIFVHTHPGKLHPTCFSLIDKESNKRLAANIQEILSEKPFGSIVLSSKGLHGQVFEKGECSVISRFVLSGKTLEILNDACIGTNHEDPAAVFDRQVRIFGEQTQMVLKNIVVTVVGLGGTGSSVAVQLARMGVGTLNLIDPDLLDEPNLPRVYGSTFSDVGKSKVEVVKKHLKDNTKSYVNIYPVDVASSDLLDVLSMSDVIFGCTDNLTSRAVLNDVSVQYLIPMIDVGARINHNPDGSLNQVIARVQVITPESGCLWCSGVLDGKLILQESFSDEEKESLGAEGYYFDVGKQPSIIVLTTLAASLAVNKFLGVMGVYGVDYHSRSQIEMVNEFSINDDIEINEDCVCAARRGLSNKRRII